MSVNYELTGDGGSKGVGQNQNSDQTSEIPPLSRPLLNRIFRRLTPSEKELALRYQILPVAWLPNRTLFAAVEGPATERVQSLGLRPVGRISVKDFRIGVRRILGPEILAKATDSLKTNHPEFSAHRRFTSGQMIWLGVAAIIFALGITVLPGEISFALTCLWFELFFLSVVSLRLMCVMDAGRTNRARPKKLADSELPVYSVLVPLFRETSVLRQLVTALCQLDYPKHLLDIKLILEENDIGMHRALARMSLPDHFDVLVVPAGKPQTKPRALNYALSFARGELLTIYDAEDRPEPDQLRKAAATFAEGPANLACLQAELTFYNANENWLTRGIMAQVPQNSKLTAIGQIRDMELISIALVKALRFAPLRWGFTEHLDRCAAYYVFRGLDLSNGGKPLTLLNVVGLSWFPDLRMSELDVCLQRVETFSGGDNDTGRLEAPTILNAPLIQRKGQTVH